MPRSFPSKLFVPSVTSRWMDDESNDRAHVLVALPSGVKKKDIVQHELLNNGSVLVVVLNWPAEMFYLMLVLTAIIIRHIQNGYLSRTYSIMARGKGKSSNLP